MTEDTLADEYVKGFQLNDFSDVKPERSVDERDELFKQTGDGVETNVENLKSETDDRGENEDDGDEDEEDEEDEEDDDDDDNVRMDVTNELQQQQLQSMSMARSPLELPTTTNVITALLPPLPLHQINSPKGLPPPHQLLTPPDNQTDHYSQQTVAFHHRHQQIPMLNSFKAMCHSNIPGTPPDTPPVSNSPSPRTNYAVELQQNFQQQQQQQPPPLSQMQQQLPLSSFNSSTQSATEASSQLSYNNRFHPYHLHHHHHHHHHPSSVSPHRVAASTLGLSDEIMLVSQSVDCSIRTPRQEPLDLRPGNCVDGGQIEIQNLNVMQHHTSVITGHHHGKRTNIFHPEYLNLQQPPPPPPQTLPLPEEHFHQLVPLHQQPEHLQQQSAATSAIFQQSNTFPRSCQTPFANLAVGKLSGGGGRSRRITDENRSYQEGSGDEGTGGGGITSFTSSNSYHLMTCSSQGMSICTTSSSSSSINDVDLSKLGSGSGSDDDELLKNDDMLVKLSVRDLNAKLKGKSRDFQLKVKQKRRTLKNRGYARNCREKRLCQKDELETTNITLKSQLDNKDTINAELTRQRDFYKQRCEIYKKKLEKFEELLIMHSQQPCSVQENLLSISSGMMTSKNAAVVDY